MPIRQHSRLACLSRPVRNRGASLLGVLFLVIVLGAAVLLALRIFPSAVEYQAVLKAVERAKNETSPASVRAAFDRAAQIDDIGSLTGKDLDITPAANNAPGFRVTFAYRKELPLFGPASLLLNYTGDTH